jgi:small subunit ribosomal protein S8
MANICNLIILIKNGYMAKKNIIQLPNSRFCRSFLDKLKSNGYILDFKEIDMKKVQVILQYIQERGKVIPALKEVYLYSKPGGAVYVKHSEISKYYRHSRFDNLFISTNKGILLGAEAINQKVGGELLCGVF